MEQARPPSPQGHPEVSVVTLHPQSVTVTAELSGRTSASVSADVRPQVGGIIQSRQFEEGSEVQAGQVLYQIDPASYQATYDSAVAAKQRADAAVPSAQSRLERYRGLIKQNAISKQDLDDAVASLTQAHADVASADASITTALINLNHTKITAPISGRIGRSSLTPGALVTPSQETALATIRTLDPINVDVLQSSTNLLDLRQAITDGRLKLSGTSVSVKLKLDNGTVYGHSGKMEFAEVNVDQSTGTFVLRAQFRNPDRLLLPGMYVRAVVEEGFAENSFLLPQRAVTRNNKGEAITLVVNADGKVEERVISVRNTVANNWLVEKGVSDGDRAIVEGFQFVRSGQRAIPIEVTIDEVTGEIKERRQAAASQPEKAEIARDEHKAANDATAEN